MTRAGPNGICFCRPSSARPRTMPRTASQRQTAEHDHQRFDETGTDRHGHEPDVQPSTTVRRTSPKPIPCGWINQMTEQGSGRARRPPKTRRRASRHGVRRAPRPSRAPRSRGTPARRAASAPSGCGGRSPSTAIPTGTRNRTGIRTHVQPSAQTISTATTGTSSSTSGWNAGYAVPAVPTPPAQEEPRHERDLVGGTDGGAAGGAVAGAADHLGPRVGCPTPHRTRWGPPGATEVGR